MADEEQKFQLPTPEQTGVTALEILRIKKGDTLLIRADATTQEQVIFIMQAVTSLLTKQGHSPGDVHMLIVPANIDINRLDADQMRRSGWVRAGRVKLVSSNGGVNFPGPQPRS